MQVSLFRNIPEEGWRGSERYADNLVRSLQALSPSDPQLSEHWVHKTGFIHYLRPVFRSLPWLKDHGHDLYFSRYCLYAQRARFWQGQINHVLDHSYAFLVHSLDPRRTVVTCHDLIPLQHEQGRVEREVYQYALAGLKKAARVIAVSEATRVRLLEDLGLLAEQVVVIPHGLEEKFRRVTDPSVLENFKNKYHLPAGFKVLNLGNNLAYKNLEGLVSGFSVLARQVGEAWLVKAGGDFTSEQRALVKHLGLEGRVLEIGFVTEEELPALYSSVDVLAAPSWEEGFGLTPLEALGCGCPVVVSNRASLPEVVGPVGLIINPEDPQALPGALALIYQRLQEGISREDLVAWAERFDWAKTAQRTLEVYSDVYAHK